MQAFTVIDGDRAVVVRATVAADRVVLEPDALREGLGWEIHDGLLCNDALCIPLPDETAVRREGGVDLAGLASALDRPLAVDAAEGVACLGASARERAQTLASQLAPDFALPDLEGRLHRLAEQRGRKVLLVAWASW